MPEDSYKSPIGQHLDRGTFGTNLSEAVWQNTSPPSRWDPYFSFLSIVTRHRGP